jgi:hypothetical protein
MRESLDVELEIIVSEIGMEIEIESAGRGIFRVGKNGIVKVNTRRLASHYSKTLSRDEMVWQYVISLIYAARLRPGGVFRVLASKNPWKCVLSIEGARRFFDAKAEALRSCLGLGKDNNRSFEVHTGRFRTSCFTTDMFYQTSATRITSGEALGMARKFGVQVVDRDGNNVTYNRDSDGGCGIAGHSLGTCVIIEDKEGNKRIVDEKDGKRDIDSEARSILNSVKFMFLNGWSF